jgi:SAM-dependent methyltransferase
MEWPMPQDKLPASGPLPANLELEETYARRFADTQQRRKDIWIVLNRHFFQKWIPPSGSVLDLGAGYCEFINTIEAAQRFALDLNPATSRHAAQGVKVLAQDVAEPWDIPPASIDVLFTSNFLEHLATKDLLTHCLREAMRILRPGGLFIAMGPNIRFAYDVYWDFFDHYLALSDRSLVEALELSRFKPQRVIPRFLPFTIKGQLPSHPLLVRLYLSVPWAWKILGKQFLVVASK